MRRIAEPKAQQRQSPAEERRWNMTISSQVGAVTDRCSSQYNLPGTAFSTPLCGFLFFPFLARRRGCGTQPRRKMESPGCWLLHLLGLSFVADQAAPIRSGAEDRFHTLQDLVNLLSTFKADNHGIQASQAEHVAERPRAAALRS